MPVWNIAPPFGARGHFGSHAYRVREIISDDRAYALRCIPAAIRVRMTHLVVPATRGVAGGKNEQA